MKLFKEDSEYGIIYTLKQKCGNELLGLQICLTGEIAAERDNVAHALITQRRILRRYISEYKEKLHETQAY
jgi:hypothetical protein